MKKSRRKLQKEEFAHLRYSQRLKKWKKKLRLQRGEEDRLSQLQRRNLDPKLRRPSQRSGQSQRSQW